MSLVSNSTTTSVSPVTPCVDGSSSLPSGSNGKSSPESEVITGQYGQVLPKASILWPLIYCFFLWQLYSGCCLSALFAITTLFIGFNITTPINCRVCGHHSHSQASCSHANLLLPLFHPSLPPYRRGQFVCLYVH